MLPLIPASAALAARPYSNKAGKNQINITLITIEFTKTKSNLTDNMGVWNVLSLYLFVCHS